MILEMQTFVIASIWRWTKPEKEEGDFTTAYLRPKEAEELMAQARLTAGLCGCGKYLVRTGKYPSRSLRGLQEKWMDLAFG